MKLKMLRGRFIQETYLVEINIIQTYLLRSPMNATKNSIYTKLNILLHRIYGQIQSSIMKFGINNGLVSTGIALLSVAKVTYDVYMELIYQLLLILFLYPYRLL